VVCEAAVVVAGLPLRKTSLALVGSSAASEDDIPPLRCRSTLSKVVQDSAELFPQLQPLLVASG